MQIAAVTAMSQSMYGAAFSDCSASIPRSFFSEYKATGRNGAVMSPGPDTIRVALAKAFLAAKGEQGAAAEFQLHHIDERVRTSRELVRLSGWIGSARGRSGEEFRAPGLAPEPE